MSYISLSNNDKKKMLARVGIDRVEDLFRCIPEVIRCKDKLHLPESRSEPELQAYFSEREQRNTHHLSFLGAGAYDHHIPAIVDYLSSRGEFISPYTPYQPEVSQGTLQIIFEFQTMICQLTGLDISNASLYEGASGTAEAVLMAHRLKRRDRILVAESVHPRYRDVIDTYTQNLNLTIEEVSTAPSGCVNMDDLVQKIDEGTAAVVVQSPNFFGVIDHNREIADLAHAKGALFVLLAAEALSLGILEQPSRIGADIVTGEAQSFGIPLSFGGPFLGFMACSQEFIRQFPGRIVGETQDIEGKRGYVLTLSTREQHIRRERATSNICTNQAWCALRATIFLESLGRRGLREMAEQNMQKTAYALEKLCRIPGVGKKFSGPVFNEFVLEFKTPWSSLDSRLRKSGIIGGYPLESDFPELKNCVLIAVTEKHTKKDIDRLISAVRAAVSRK